MSKTKQVSKKIYEMYEIVKSNLCPLVNDKSCNCKTCHNGTGSSTTPSRCKYCLKRRNK